MRELLAIHEIRPFPAQSDIQFWLDLADLGMLHYEHWALLNNTDDGSRVAQYYRVVVLALGSTLAASSSRAAELTAEQRATVAVTYQSPVGWDVDAQHCTFDNSVCTIPADVTVRVCSLHCKHRGSSKKGKIV